MSSGFVSGVLFSCSGYDEQRYSRLKFDWAGAITFSRKWTDQHGVNFLVFKLNMRYNLGVLLYIDFRLNIS